ncbi:hypothetical protein C8P68_101306 [Mucilaginibacter yixingensis]|uniref:Uncharacterized protein n=1 Tax=Mucilaginibacter yixingensis TaxID=1295612 RepID=A0A2T5JF94_9SPHI|nr:hypothetical protein [Mucilaginibacter yixingensis]PTR01075.1 hypothetical protein C8P68_101306 [Mucilaginibacter yixingensis]
MRILFISFLLMALSGALSAQPVQRPVKEFFVLGTMQDYMGRLVRQNDDELDIYYRVEKPIVFALNAMLPKIYPYADVKLDVLTRTNGDTSGFKLTCDTVARRINAYYDYTQPHYHVKLKGGIFRTDDERLAFIAGAYARFGAKCDTAWCISIANSIAKTRLLDSLLKHFGCKSVEIVKNDYIPVGHWLYFHPTKKVEAYLQQYVPLNREQQAYQEGYFQRMLKQAQERAAQRKAKQDSANAKKN